MKTVFFLLPVVLFTNLVYAQNDSIISPTLEDMGWIAGNWKGEAFGGLVEEHWSEPSGKSMMATFKLVVDNEVQFYEIEIIRETDSGIVLQLKHFNADLTGWEHKDDTVDFPLKYMTRDKIVFEGMTFTKISKNEMDVSVDLKQKDGSVQTLTINYLKQ